MPTDPRDTGWTVLATDANGYSDLIQFNGLHAQTFRFGAVKATTTEIWFEEAIDNDTTNCQKVFYDDSAGTTDRLKITVPTGEAANGFTVKVDPAKYGGLNWVRIQLTDGTSAVQQDAAVAVSIGCRDYR